MKVLAKTMEVRLNKVLTSWFFMSRGIKERRDYKIHDPEHNNEGNNDFSSYRPDYGGVVALTTGTDGTVSITLADGNVTYVANTATATATNNYATDSGSAFSGKLSIFSDAAGTQKVGAVQMNWN